MHKTKAEIITIGDEILYGQILDSNSQWISAELDNIGVKVLRKTTIGDVESDIMQAFQEAEKRADVVLITGGLGPTNDDLTKPCLAKYFECRIEINEQALQELKAMFESKDRPLSELNRLQAALPVCCTPVTNLLGTAPGMWFERQGKVFVSMPGVPHEMKKMMEDTILPKIQNTFRTEIIYHKLVKTVGIPEAGLAEKIASWEIALPQHIKLAYLPSLGQVRLRLTATGENLEQLKNDVATEVEKLQPLASRYIYGYDEDKLEEVVGHILREQQKTMATAESCTGGYLAHLITSIPGSSDYFMGGVIPYDNERKIEILEVERDTIIRHGAVSEETVSAMAQNVRKKFNADIGVATSGVAGPGGGTPEKPVGTVWIAYSDARETITKKLQLWQDRSINIKVSSVLVLNLARQ